MTSNELWTIIDAELKRRLADSSLSQDARTAVEVFVSEIRRAAVAKRKAELQSKVVELQERLDRVPVRGSGGPPAA